MGLKGQIISVEVTYLIHATEDEGKVEAAVSRLLGGTRAPAKESLEGHFGNKILKVKFQLTGDDATSALRRLLAEMPGDLKKEIASKIESFVDEHLAFYLRLDKQRLVSGEVAMALGEPVRLKVKLRKFNMEGGARDFYVHLLEGA